MKHITVIILGLLLLVCQASYSQYEMRLENDQLVSGTVYEFDVYMRSTSGTINLTSYQIALNYNTSIANGGTLTFSYIAGSSASSLVPNLGVAVRNDASQGASNLTAASNAGSDGIDGTGKKLGRFRLSNTVTFATLTGNIAWDFTGTYKTIVNINSTNQTVQSNHTNILGNQPLPITLASFTAQMSQNGGGVLLEWRTLSEVNNYGYYVQRRMESDTAYTEIASSFLAGHGTTVEPQEYSYVDNTVQKAGQYSYRLRQVDLDGREHFTPGTGVVVAGLMSVKEVAPKEFKLNQNYPNPFNPSTELKFSVETTGRATLRIYSITGQEVATLFDGQAEAGQYYRVKLDGSSLASGIYFYRLESGSKSDLKKMMLLK